MPSKEFEFYLKANLKPYQGKYIVILENKIIASGDTAEIWTKIKKEYPSKNPMLAKVPTEETLVL